MLLYLQDDRFKNFPVPTFTAMDPSYSLPDSVAIVTLQVLSTQKLMVAARIFLFEVLINDLIILVTSNAIGA